MPEWVFQTNWTTKYFGHSGSLLFFFGQNRQPLYWHWVRFTPLTKLQIHFIFSQTGFVHTCLFGFFLFNPIKCTHSFFFKFCCNEYDYLNTTPTTTTTTKCVHFETPFSVLIKAAFWDLAFCVLQMLTASWAAQHSLKAYRFPGCDRKIYRDDDQKKLREAQHLIVSFVHANFFFHSTL